MYYLQFFLSAVNAGSETSASALLTATFGGGLRATGSAGLTATAQGRQITAEAGR